MSQFTLDIAAPRRIDITLERLDESLETLTPEQREALAKKPWWSVLVTVSRLRSMELSEESVRGSAIAPMADAYDRVAKPGEHAVAALLRAFQAVYGPKSEAA